MVAESDKVFKALADPGRRLLLDRLHDDNGQTLGQLCEHLSMTRQAVTKHLKKLEDAWLVGTVWRGREKFHYLNPVPIHEITERWIGKYERGRLRLLAELKRNLEGWPMILASLKSLLETGEPLEETCRWPKGL
jgi:DNA-binding transcriptional ArsR family regulator